MHYNNTALKYPIVLMLGLMFLPIQWVHAWNIELSEAELQEKINKRVPIEKKKLLFTVLVSAIDVELKEGSDRIGLVADMEIHSPHLSSGKGRAWLDGELSYKAEDGTFYFLEPVVRAIKFENLPDKYQGLVKAIFQKAISRRLTNTAVYQLDQNKIKHKLAKALLKSVKVIDAKLVLEMGLF
jgi:hypothetical protein